MSVELTPEDWKNIANLNAGYSKNQNLDVVTGTNSLPNQIADEEVGSMSTAGQIAEGIPAAFRGTLWGSLGYAKDLIQASDVDPAFKLDDHKELTQGLDPVMQKYMEGAQSLRMANTMREQIDQHSKDQYLLSHMGFIGKTAEIAAGLFDPVNLATIAVPEFTLASKIGGSGRIAGMARGAIANAEYSAVSGTATAFVEPTGSWTNVTDSVIDGLKFGTVLGATGLLNQDPLVHKINKELDAMQRTMHEFSDPEYHAMREPGTQHPQNMDTAPKVTPDAQVSTSVTPGAKFDSEGSIGAAYIPEAGESFNPELAKGETLKARQNSRTFLANEGVAYKEDMQFPDTPTGKMAANFQEGVQKSPFATYFDRFWNSPSLVLREFAYKTMESAAGIVRNNLSSANLQEMYHNQLLAKAKMQDIEAHMVTWGKDTSNLKDTGPMFWKVLDPGLRDKFSREVLTELKLRRMNAGLAPAEERGIHKSVSTVADNIDESSALARRILQSEDGLSPVRGSENLYDGPGYFPQLMNGREIVRLVREGATLGQIKQCLENSLRNTYPTFSDEAVKTTAAAYVTRARAMSEGLDTNMYRLLSQHGELWVRDYLANNLSIPQRGIDAIVEGLTAATSDKQKAGFLRHRLELDLSTPIPGTKFTLMDLMHRDVTELWTRYTRQVAGHSALARNGYQYADKEKFKNLVMDELNASGNQNHRITEDTINDIWSHFGGGPISGAPTPGARRLLSLTALSVYGGMGLWQAAEASAGMAAFGMNKYMQELRVAMKADDAMTKQMSHLIGGVVGEERLYNEKFHYDMFQHSATGSKLQDDLLQFVDRGLAAGRDLQGLLSGFYKVRNLEQKTTMRLLLWELHSHLSDLGTGKFDARRFADLGLDEKLSNRLKKYFTGSDPIVKIEKDEAGQDFVNLHLDKWHPKDEMELGGIVNRGVNQFVQKTMVGETIPWMHKGVAAFMMQGKSFTMNSVQKQFVRSAKFGDHSMYMAMGFGMLAGSAGYMASQLLAGNFENLDPVQVVKGGIANSNMSGWIPGFWDVPMSMLGWNSLAISPYGISPRSGIIGVPPIIGNTNNLLHLPAVPFDALTGEFAGQDRASLKALPIIGNLPYTKGFWNAL